MVRKLPILLLLSFAYLHASAQHCDSYFNAELQRPVYTRVNVNPEFAGGAGAWQRFLHRNLKLPQDMIDHEDLYMSATSTVKFIVDTNGLILHPIVRNQQDTTQLNSFDKELLRVVRLMPRWEPGMCNGQKVPVEVTRPLMICTKLETQ